jgi:hypothetical protein
VNDWYSTSRFFPELFYISICDFRKLTLASEAFKQGLDEYVGWRMILPPFK